MAKKPNSGGVAKAEADARRMELGMRLSHWPDEERGSEALKAFFESEAGQAALIRTVMAQHAFLDEVAAYLGIQAETPPELWRAIALALAREKFPAPKRRGRPEKITTLADHYAKAERARGGRPGLSEEEIKEIGASIPKMRELLKEAGQPCSKIAAVTKLIAWWFGPAKGWQVSTSPAQILARLAMLERNAGKPSK